MQKVLPLFLSALLATSAHAVVDEAQKQNSVCYIKTHAPSLVFGEIPFTCDGKPEKFISRVSEELSQLKDMTLIPNIDSCSKEVFKDKNMLNIARGVWDLRDSPIMPTHIAIASSIADVCKDLDKKIQPGEHEEGLPSNVNSSQSYRPFRVKSKSGGNDMSDIQIARNLMCKPPESIVAETMNLLNNYVLVDSDKTDGTMTITSFSGNQDGKDALISLAIDERANPRVLRYVFVNDSVALSCKTP